MNEHWSSPNWCHPDCPQCAADSPEAVVYASVGWTPADVQSLAPSMTTDQAADWLVANSNHIQSRLAEVGWDVLETLLSIDGISKE